MVFIDRKNPILFDDSELKAVGIGLSGYEYFVKILEAFRWRGVYHDYLPWEGCWDGNLKQLLIFS